MYILQDWGSPIKKLTPELLDLERELNFCNSERCPNHKKCFSDPTLHCIYDEKSSSIIKQMYDISDHRHFCVVLDDKTHELLDIVRVSPEAELHVAEFNAEYTRLGNNSNNVIYKFVIGIHNTMPFKKYQTNLTNPIDYFRNAPLQPYSRIDYRVPPKYANPQIFAMRDRMIFAGGDYVQLQMDKDDIILIQRGEFFPGEIGILYKMDNRACHRNACLYHSTHPTAKVCTGYALNEFGEWYCHSWCLDETSGKKIIIETTMLRIAYFGYVMTDQEAYDFAKRTKA